MRVAGPMAACATTAASDAVQAAILPDVRASVCGDCRLHRFFTEELLRCRLLLLRRQQLQLLLLLLLLLLLHRLLLQMQLPR